jgi:hypothetical protein
MTGKRSFGNVKRESIVVGGVRQLRESAGVDETSGNKVLVATFQRVGG